MNTMACPIPAAAVIHDLSGLGRCALSVALPTLSVLGVQGCALPTALLSAHTGFPGSAPVDQTPFLEAALAHWAAMDRTFQGVYTGYLAQPGQAPLLAELLADQRRRGMALAVVDPAMADHGKLYRGCLPRCLKPCGAVRPSQRHPAQPHRGGAAHRPGLCPAKQPLQAAGLGRALLDLGCGAALITGLRLGEDWAANVLFPGGEGFWVCPYRPLPCAFPGAGDLFAAAFTGFALTGAALEEAMGRATAFVYQAMKRTLEAATPTREGLCFEPMLACIRQLQPLPWYFLRAPEAAPAQGDVWVFPAFKGQRAL